MSFPYHRLIIQMERSDGPAADVAPEIPNARGPSALGPSALAPQCSRTPVRSAPVRSANDILRRTGRAKSMPRQADRLDVTALLLRTARGR